jgi:ABC-type uncharacterized transport system involved in gliding motility auxiliary subunit
LAGIAAGLAGATFIVVALLWWAVSKKFLWPPLLFCVAGAGAIAAYVVTNRERLVSFCKQRTSREFVNSTAFAFFVLGIVVLVNIIGARHHWRHDFTESKRYSLSEQTMKILRGLDKPVRITAFISPDYYDSEEIRSRLREYDIASPKTEVTIYDPKTNIDKAREFNVRYDGTTIITCGDKKEEVTGGSEEQLTSAILAVTKGEKTKIYFLAGHGERRMDTMAEDSISDLKSNLENQQYEVKELVLLKEKEPKIPGDCAVLCIVGPTQPLAQKEITAINKYLDQGGKLFVALEVPPAPDLHEILGGHGIKVLNGIVFDPVVNLWGNVGIPLVVHPEDHEITSGQPSIFFPGSRAFEIEEEAPAEPSYPGGPPPQPQKKGTELLMTSDSAWVDTNFKPGIQPKKDAGERSGRLCLAVAVDESKEKPPTYPGMPHPPEEEGEGKGTRIVAVGDSDFLTQTVRTISPVGIVFALKSIAWLAKEEKLVSVPPKEQSEKRIVLSGAQLKLVVILIFAVPVLILLTGVGVWVMRRGG